jgi:hypothetical protein
MVVVAVGEAVGMVRLPNWAEKTKIARDQQTAALMAHQSALLAHGDVSGGRGVLDQILKTSFTDQARQAVLAQAGAEARQEGRSEVEQLQIWAAPGQAEPLRQIAWYSQLLEANRDNPQGRVTGLTAFVDYYRTGFWVVEALVEVSRADLRELQDPVGAATAARRGLGIERYGPQAQELYALHKDAADALRKEPPRDWTHPSP